MRHRVAATLWLPWVMLGTWSHSAQAQEGRESGIVSAGYIHSFVWGDSPAAGNGVEVSYEYYENLHEPVGVGGFLQLQDYSGTRREALGVQANAYFFGAEVGWAHRGADADHVSTHGLHLGLFASAGAALVSFRVVPVLSTQEPSHGTELSLTLGLKFFFTLHGENLEVVSMPHGRPMRVAGEVRTLRTASLPAWTDAALAEHESVASFAALAIELLRHGAPRELIRDCHEAARDELRHVDFCEHRTPEATPGAPALGPLLLDYTPSSLEQVLVDCFLDGCLGEGFAALRAELAVEHLQALDAQAGLLQLAREERGHARLAWRIVEWIQRTSPPTYARALTRALREVATQVPPAQEAYGVLPAALGALAFELTRHAVCERASESLRQIDSASDPPLSG